jgi:hypothetical protein
MSRALRVAVVSLALASLADGAAAQYFGRNKVQYLSFEFRVLKTEHFHVRSHRCADADARDVLSLLVHRPRTEALRRSSGPSVRSGI